MATKKVEMTEKEFESWEKYKVRMENLKTQRKRDRLVGRAIAYVASKHSIDADNKEVQARIDELMKQENND